MSNVFLSIIWNKAEQTLREVQTIIFSGYSFPDADMHIKCLIKRIQTNRKTGLPKIVVCNNFPGKNSLSADEEKNRFKRFLGNNVDYTDLSFEEFANDPMLFIR